MKIETKFAIGDGVYIVEYSYNRKKVKCGYCNGTGEIIAFNKKPIECSVCIGRGAIDKISPSRKWRVHKKVIKIEGMEIFYYGDDSADIMYNHEYTTICEEDCFATLEDARNECKKRNRKNRGKNEN